MGTHLTLNTGCMTHGTIGSGTSGMSKALAMSLCLLICPLNMDQDMNFSAAWYPACLANLPKRNLEILWYLDLAVTKHYWVSWFGLGYFLGLGFCVAFLATFFILKIITDYTWNDIIFQIFPSVDGLLRFATQWPHPRTYMSGNSLALELELMILVDELAHAFQKMLQIENLDGKPDLAFEDFKLAPNAKMNLTPDNNPDDLPYMGDPTPLYTKKVLHEFMAGLENTRKLLISE